ncbi:MAG: GntR family transcriptional regulator [Proteobacteria bacterium]|nr:GntR family transcriptional regulator [Pseudomonadota bacterium]
MDEADVEGVMRRVLMSGRLRPGTKLVETKLASVFGVSRERVRGVLKRLSHDRLVLIEKHRGAFVMPVDLSDARATYEARRILESGIMMRLVECVTPADIARLRRHLSQEIGLQSQHDRTATVRLAGEFHMLMAQIVGNEMILRQLQELIGRSTALVTFFEPESAATCTCEEHGLVLEAVAKRDSALAVRAMTSHLSLIETRLRPRICEALDTSLESAIAEEMRLFRAERVLDLQAS